MAAVEMRAMFSFTYPCFSAGNRQTNGAEALIVCMRVWDPSQLNIVVIIKVNIFPQKLPLPLFSGRELDSDEEVCAVAVLPR